MSLARACAISRVTASCVLAAALLLLAPNRPSYSQSGAALTVAEYRAQLEQARAQIAAAHGRDVAGAVQQAATEVAAIGSVVLPDGTRVELLPLLAASESQREALADLDAVLAQLRQSEGDDAAPRLAALDKVLAGEALNPDGGWLAWLRRLLGGPGSEPVAAAADQGARLLETLLTIGAALVLVFVLGRIVQAALGSFLREGDIRREADAAAPMTVAAVRRRAADLAAAGSYRDAVRQLYLATLLSLEDRGLLRIDRSLTNREVLASVAQWQEVQRGLLPVVDAFETVWYGEREPDREMFQRYSTEVQSAVTLIEQAPPTAAPRAREEPA